MKLFGWFKGDSVVIPVIGSGEIYEDGLTLMYVLRKYSDEIIAHYGGLGMRISLKKEYGHSRDYNGWQVDITHGRAIDQYRVKKLDALPEDILILVRSLADKVNKHYKEQRELDDIDKQALRKITNALVEKVDNTAAKILLEDT